MDDIDTEASDDKIEVASSSSCLELDDSLTRVLFCAEQGGFAFFVDITLLVVDISSDESVVVDDVQRQSAERGAAGAANARSGRRQRV